MLNETVNAKGHENVLSNHKSTSEFTSENHLTPRGDCIYAVGSYNTMADLSEAFKEALRSEDATLEIVIECNGVSDTLTARGHPDLMLNHPTDFVIRKSSFICSRTLAVNADKASSDLDRGLIRQLQSGYGVVIKLRLS